MPNRFLSRFASDESGATAIEYGLILAGVFLVILGSVQLFAGRFEAIFNAASDAITGAG